MDKTVAVETAAHAVDSVRATTAPEVAITNGVIARKEGAGVLMVSAMMASETTPPTGARDAKAVAVAPATTATTPR
jgi:hypothetical protein